MMFAMRVRSTCCGRGRSSRCRWIRIIVGLEQNDGTHLVLDVDRTRRRSVKTHISSRHRDIMTIRMIMSFSLLSLPFQSHNRRILRCSLRTPISMTKLPSLTLTSLTTILRLPTSPTFREFPGKSLPLSTLHIGALSDAILSFVLPACVAHDHSSPVLHFVGVTRCEFVGVRRAVGEGFDEGEDI